MNANTEQQPFFSLPRSESTLVQCVSATHGEITTVSEPWILLPNVYTLRNVGVYLCRELPGGAVDYLNDLCSFILKLYAKASPQITRYLILKANSDKIVCWESEQDRSIAYAWNEAVDCSIGDLIVFLDAYNHLVRVAVLRRIAFLQANSGECFVSGRVLLLGGDWDGVLPGSPWDWRKFCWRVTVPQPAYFYSRKIFDEAEIYDEPMRIALDYGLLLRLKQELSLYSSIELLRLCPPVA